MREGIKEEKTLGRENVRGHMERNGVRKEKKKKNWERKEKKQRGKKEQDSRKVSGSVVPISCDFTPTALPC